MIPRRSSGESCAGSGHDAIRSSIVRSTRSWIGVALDGLVVTSLISAFRGPSFLFGTAGAPQSSQWSSEHQAAEPAEGKEEVPGSAPLPRPLSSRLLGAHVEQPVAIHSRRAPT